MVTKVKLQELQKQRDVLMKLKRELNNVKSKSGMYNIARLSKEGLIKEHITKKGRKEQGRIVGRKSHYVLTEKGKRIYSNISKYVM